MKINGWREIQRQILPQQNPEWSTKQPGSWAGGSPTWLSEPQWKGSGSPGRHCFPFSSSFPVSSPQGYPLSIC